MKLLVFLAVAALLYLQPLVSFAAFPVKQSRTDSVTVYSKASNPLLESINQAVANAGLGKIALPHDEELASGSEDGLSMASLILGIVAIVSLAAAVAFLPYLGILTLLSGIAAIITGGISLKERIGDRQMARAGLILGIISLGIPIVIGIIGLIALALWFKLD